MNPCFVAASRESAAIFQPLYSDGGALTRRRYERVTGPHAALRNMPFVCCGLYSHARPAMMRRVPVQGVLWSLFGVAALFLAYGVWVFNRLILLRNRLREAWSGVDVQLKRRHDLVPNLVECVQGYRAHEQSLLESLARGRSAARKIV